MWWFRVVLIVLPIMVQAAAIPTLGSDPKHFNMEHCIQGTIQDCIKATCIPNAPTDCREQCRANAKNKCHALAGQLFLDK